MQIAKQTIGDVSVLVNPDGSLVEHKDTDKFVFHVMPKLYMPYSDIAVKDIKFISATIVFKNKSPQRINSTNSVVSQPYPNDSYYVAGSQEDKMGWMLDYDREDPPVKLMWQWYIIPTDQYLTNDITLTFEENPSGHIFTTDQNTVYTDLCSFDKFDDISNTNISVESLENEHKISQQAHLVSRPLSHCMLDHLRDAVYFERC